MTEEFIRYLRRDRKSEKTISLYTHVIEEFQEWYCKSHDCKFQYLKKSDVAEYEKYLETTKNCKLSTIKVRTSILLKFSIFLLYYYCI